MIISPLFPWQWVSLATAGSVSTRLMNMLWPYMYLSWMVTMVTGWLWMQAISWSQLKQPDKQEGYNANVFYVFFICLQSKIKLTGCCKTLILSYTPINGVFSKDRHCFRTNVLNLWRVAFSIWPLYTPPYHAFIALFSFGLNLSNPSDSPSRTAVLRDFILL